MKVLSITRTESLAQAQPEKLNLDKTNPKRI
jgi:hypothetical protein